MKGITNFITSRKNQLGLFFILLGILGWLVVKFPEGTTKVGQALFTMNQMFFIVMSAFSIGIPARLMQKVKYSKLNIKTPSTGTITFLQQLKELLMDMGGLVASILVVAILSYFYYWCQIEFLEWWGGYAILYVAYVGGNVDGKGNGYIGTFKDGTA